MPATLFLGHLLALLAVFAILASFAFAIAWVRHRGFGRGTPQYARARSARRSAAYALVLAILLAGLCLTPLCEIVLAGGGG